MESGNNAGAMSGNFVPRCTPSHRRPAAALGLCLTVSFLLAAAVPGPAADLPPAQLYLQQALRAANQVQLGGDQSALRREVALALMKVDEAGARQAIAGVGRASDTARTLAALAAALAAKNPAAAKEAAVLGGRLLQRIPEPERRAEEYRLYLREIAVLGAEAPGAVAEAPTNQARLVVVESLARQDPAKALTLAKQWVLKAPEADAAFAALAPRLAASTPEEAVRLALGIGAPELRERTLWLIAEARPPGEAPGIAAQMQDPIAQAGVLNSAAQRLAEADPEAALAAADSVPVSPVSARAQVVVTIARSNPAKGAELARQLPEPARGWALGQLALAAATSQPEQAEGYLREAGGAPELTTLVAARMAPADPERALRIARALSPSDREMVLAEVAIALAPTRVAQAKDVVWEISAPAQRDRAIAAVARQLARTDTDAATSLLGLVSDPAQLPARRAEVAAVVAARDPATAQRLLESLPAGETRVLRGLEAGEARLANGGKMEEAARLAALGLPADLGLRWLLPVGARLGVGALGDAAEKQEQPYWRGLGLTDAARVLLHEEAVPTPVPERMRLIRPIVEWEGS